jgi:hypothetical protein
MVKCSELPCGWMARHAIVEKLVPKLQEQISDESQAVYIMVELRKLLERDGLKSTYDLVNFYGNWVVHPQLEKCPIADQIVRFFDDLQRIDAGEMRPTKRGISRLIGHVPFQRQLRDCLVHFALPTSLSEDAQFGAFRVELGNVLEECPLLIQKRNGKEAKTCVVESVTVKARRDERNRVIFDWVPTFHTEPEYSMGPISMVF